MQLSTSRWLEVWGYFNYALDVIARRYVHLFSKISVNEGNKKEAQTACSAPLQAIYQIAFAVVLFEYESDPDVDAQIESRTDCLP